MTFARRISPSGEIGIRKNGLHTQPKDLSLGALQKGLPARSSIKEKFQLPRSACFQSGAFQLTKLGSLTPNPNSNLPSWKTKGDRLASSEKPCGFPGQASPSTSNWILILEFGFHLQGTFHWCYYQQSDSRRICHVKTEVDKLFL